MTESMHHCTFFQREQMSHFLTFWIRMARFSGSDFMIWSNSANFPGRKKTLVRPNLKSFSFSPRALKRAWFKRKRQWSTGALHRTIMNVDRPCRTSLGPIWQCLEAWHSCTWHRAQRTGFCWGIPVASDPGQKSFLWRDIRKWEMWTNWKRLSLSDSQQVMKTHLSTEAGSGSECLQRDGPPFSHWAWCNGWSWFPK